MKNTVLLAGLTAGAAAQNFTELERFWSYGRSDPVPAPIANGTGNWTAAYNRARALVGQMTNLEKNNLTYGFPTTTGCSGVSGSVPRLGFPGLCLQDAGNGVRGTDLVNSYASGLHVGATWNSDLAYQRGQYMGAEFKAKGVNVALGPVVGPLGRVARGGRNWEGFSNDPYLSGVLVAPTIAGMQESVIACVKHFVGNEQETLRGPSAQLTNITALSVNIDDKAMHEQYLWPFQDAVHAGAASAMASYNKLNGSFASQSAKALNGLLKLEDGFQGFVVSDWYGQHTGIASANAGLDMAMPSSSYWLNGTLANAVANGTVSQARLDDMAHRIIAAWYFTNQANSSFPAIGLAGSLSRPHARVDARDPASMPLRVQQAVEGHVLVKNVNNTLPLKAPKFLSLFGYDAYAPLTENPMATGGLNPFTLGGESVTVNASIWQQAFQYANISELPQAAYKGTLISGGGSGANTPAYINSPFEAFSQRAYDDGTFLFWDFVSQNPVVDPASEACIVFINEFATESVDRSGLADPYSDVLVQNVANNCSNTMVVIHNAGIRLVNNWIDHPNITAVIYAHLPGQDSGRSLVQVMYGEQSPSGRLPYTVAKNASDYGNMLNPVNIVANNQSFEYYYPQDNFTEGVYIDYKSFIRYNITPQFEFGFGLTYTNFTYSGLRTAMANGTVITLAPPAAATLQGGNPHLWDVIATVDATVTNSGKVAAQDVSQLYIGIPGGPAKQLRGFKKQMIAPGASKSVHFDLTRRDLSSWDVVRQQWMLQAGSYKVYVGESVLDVRLTGSLNVVTNSLGA